MRRIATALLSAALLAAMVAAPVGAASPASRGNVADSTAARPTVDRSIALVQLKGEPLATYVKTKPAPGKKVDLTSSTTKAYRAQLSALRNDFKQWLQANAPKARISASFDISLNAVSVKLNGESIATLRTAPQVARAQYQGIYYKTMDDPDLALIEGPAGWAAVGGAASAGEGVKVAIIDSGIDVTHPCFADDGYPAQTQLGDTRFTNDKVIVAKVFNMKARSRGYTAQAIDSHGTHVAGTVACNHLTPAAVDGVAIPYAPSGVAPRALLGNYNVFPSTVENARSEDILNALEAAYADGFDVANMSLGGPHAGIADLLTIAVDNLDRANMVVAISSGNEGPGHYTVGSPGSAARALTAGGGTVGHFVGAQVSVGASTYAAVVGDFETVQADLTAPLAVLTAAPVNPVNGYSVACGPIGTDLTGTIAVIGRGVCDFSTKIRYAELAGASAVLVVNRLPGDPTAMAQGASPDGIQPAIPAYMISLESGTALKSQDGAAATIAAAEAYFYTGNDDIQYDASSQGPTDVDFRVKPDVVAPAVNVLSSVPGSDCGPTGCWAFFSGTSMASPHLAGAAAVVRGAHPTWTAAQVRSAIVNSADRDVLVSFEDATTPVTDVNIQGAGQLDLGAAVGATAAIEPVSITFGAVPSGSGQTRTMAVSLANLGTAAATWSLSIEGTTGSGVTFSVAPSTATLAAGASTSVTVTMTAAKGASFGDHQAWLLVKSGGREVAHAAVYTLVK